ncbi:hypothetical protein, partial [Acinetobacter towneri]|uniref:hypothetical protein n=1 Tax=Acinetobacter towneri TaxID=202956 RepID=UPI0034D3CB85
DLKNNEITPNNPDTDILDDMPTANESGQEGKNSKKLKVVLFIFIGVVIMLIGIGVSMGRFQASSAASKAEEAEKAAQEQKQLADGKSVDIATDQQEIENTNFQALPCPVSDPTCQPQDGLTGEEIVEPVQAQQTEQPVVQPVQPSYSTYNQSTDYLAPEPVQPVQSYEAPLTAANPVPSPQDDDVLVDINTKVAVTAASQNQKETGLAKSFESSKLNSGNASKRGDTSMLLAKGTAIPCVLNTKIDSTYKG